ncbi:MAG: hypothetical protein FD169_1369, partial [Bacillota bacterium]
NRKKFICLLISLLTLLLLNSNFTPSLLLNPQNSLWFSFVRANGYIVTWQSHSVNNSQHIYGTTQNATHTDAGHRPIERTNGAGYLNLSRPAVLANLDYRQTALACLMLLNVYTIRCFFSKAIGKRSRDIGNVNSSGNESKKSINSISLSDGNSPKA